MSSRSPTRWYRADTRRGESGLSGSDPHELMLPLDGNAIAGALHDVFGCDMTTELGACEACGAGATFAELRVYLTATGAVARCPSCGGVVFVVVEVHGEAHFHRVAFKPGP